MVTNGVQLSTQGLCRGIQWEAQGSMFSINFLVLLVRGCDLVLGIQWLLPLRPIMWNFVSLEMQFEYEGQTHVL